MHVKCDKRKIRDWVRERERDEKRQTVMCPIKNLNLLKKWLGARSHQYYFYWEIIGFKWASNISDGVNIFTWLTWPFSSYISFALSSLSTHSFVCLFALRCAVLRWLDSQQAHFSSSSPHITSFACAYFSSQLLLLVSLSPSSRSPSLLFLLWKCYCRSSFRLNFFSFFIFSLLDRK